MAGSAHETEVQPRSVPETLEAAPQGRERALGPLVSGSQVDSITPPGLEPQAFPSED